MTESYSRPLRVFLCHSSGDKSTVRELYDQLNTQGWIDPWLDVIKLLPGQDFNLEIEKAVEKSDIVLVCLSNQSVDKEGYIQKELRFVLNIADEKPEGAIFVIPLRLDDCVVPRRLRNWQYVDYFPKNKRNLAFQRLLESLKIRAAHLRLSTGSLVQPPDPDTNNRAPLHFTPTVGPKPIPSVINNDVSTTLNPIWFYLRLLILFLLILGYFGPWFEFINTTGAMLYDSFLIQSDYRKIMPLAIGALFLLTLVRLFLWKFKPITSIEYLERLVAGISSIAILTPGMTFYVSILREPRWGLLSTIVGVYIATLIILLEKRANLQKGQRLPWWSWLLVISIILPWFAVISRFMS